MPHDMDAPDARTDADLIQAFTKGEQEALTQLVERYLPAVFRFVVRMVSDADLTRDIVQESFIKAWKHLASYRSQQSFKVWLFTIAKHTTIDALRKKTPIVFSRLEQAYEELDIAEAIVDPQPLVDERLVQEEMEKELHRYLDQLPAKARSIMIMHELEGLTFQEIGEIMGESLNTVKSRHRRALLFLQERAPKSK